MRALVLKAEARTGHLREIPIPEPAPNELLIAVKAVALNPVDSLYMYNPLAQSGRTLGSDFAGVISAVGAAVPSEGGLAPGTRVAGFLQGACSVNARPGAFAEYLICPWDLVWKIGHDMTNESAATISLCGLTAAQALFSRMGLEAPFPWNKSGLSPDASAVEHERAASDTLSVFIYGATTSVGLYAAQLAHISAERSGRTIKLIGTASPRHFPLLQAKPYCYDELVDYRDNDWPAKILDLSDGKGVDYAYDCISEGSTVLNTARTLSSYGKMAVVRSREGGAWKADDLRVEPSYGAVWEGLGEEVQYQGMNLPASPEARAFAVAFYQWLSEGGHLEPNTTRVMPGGLTSIVRDGLKLLGAGSMQDREEEDDRAWMRPLSAEKMVYFISSD